MYYNIPVYNNEETKIEFLLWFFDNHNDICKGEKSYGCINNEQIQWYINESNKYYKKYNHIIPGLAFLHVPPQEYLYGQKVLNIYIIIIILE